jgi:hypothetical protein
MRNARRFQIFHSASFCLGNLKRGNLMGAGQTTYPPGPKCDCCAPSANCDSSHCGTDTSGGPIRYATGEIVLNEVDLEFKGFGRPWGQTRSYDNLFAFAFNGVCGNNWYVSQIPYLQGSGGNLPSQIIYVGEPTQPWAYTRVGETNEYEAVYFQNSTLTYDEVANQFVVIEPSGNQIWFYGFDAGLKAGQIRALVDRNGELVPADYDEDGRLVSLARIFQTPENEENDTVGATGFFYTYTEGESYPGKLASVTLRINGRGFRRVKYTYYGDNDDHGSEWDLKLAEVEQWNEDEEIWENIRTSYYRYYVEDAGVGFVHGLKYVVTGEAYVRLDAEYGPVDSATDAEVGEFANNYFEYNSNHYAVKEKTDGGAYEYTFSYQINLGASIDPNIWLTKTIETLPDDTENIVYCNGYAQALFKVYKSGSDEWYEWFEYDEKGRILQRATSAAVEGYDSGANTWDIHEDEGLIYVYEYYDGTPSDQPVGYRQYEGGDGRRCQQAEGISVRFADFG